MACHQAAGDGPGEHLTDVVRAVAQENPRMQRVIDVAEFNATTTGQRIVDDGRLAALIEVLSRCRLGLNDVASVRDWLAQQDLELTASAIKTDNFAFQWSRSRAGVQ